MITRHGFRSLRTQVVGRCCLWLLLAALAFPGASFALNEHAGERRLALVIGNSDYRQHPLRNPVNDAKALAESLTSLGFEVVLRENAGVRSMLEAIREFALRAKNSDVRLFFYAGHGIQTRGRNYLVPVDAEINSEDQIPLRSVDIGELLERLGELRHGLNIFILDACRTNPFKDGLAVGPDGRRIKFRGAVPSGLTALEAPMGTVVAFSTAPGAVALDGATAKHSLYTQHLLAHIDTPGLTVEQMFKKVRIGVAEETQRMQVPWENSSLTGDFCFRTNPDQSCGEMQQLLSR